MDWLNLHISVLDSPEATLCDPVRRATWIWLLRFCIGQENGGRIKKCSTWGDTTWQQMARVRLREVNSESTLWSWDGEDLVVHFYPTDKEAEVKANREHGRRGGRPVGRRDNHPVNHPVIENITDRFDSAKTEGKGRGMERKGKEDTPAAAAAVVAPDHPAAAAALRAKVKGYSKSKVLAAIAAEDLPALVAAFGGNDRGDEWARDAAGHMIGKIAAVFDWRLAERSPIREPSGLRKALAEWSAQPIAWQQSWACEFATELGITLRTA
jgi:hypothetical protein